MLFCSFDLGPHPAQITQRFAFQRIELLQFLHIVGTWEYRTNSFYFGLHKRL